jgi:hypothetical protein
MIGEREIMIDVLLLTEMSRAERAAGRADCQARKNERITRAIVLPSGGGAAARRRHRAKQHRGGKSHISCRPRPGTRPGGLAEIPVRPGRLPGQMRRQLRIAVPAFKQCFNIHRDDRLDWLVH